MYTSPNLSYLTFEMWIFVALYATGAEPFTGFNKYMFGQGISITVFGCVLWEEDTDEDVISTSVALVPVMLHDPSQAFHMFEKVSPCGIADMLKQAGKDVHHLHNSC